MDPGPVPELPALSEIEEMLIARVHVAMQVRQVHGQQYKYSGHVVNFLRNTGRVYNSLPLLPQDLDIVILRPSNANSEEGLRRQFRQECCVRKRVVWVWLDYLRHHHPGYAGITLNESNLQQLPDDMDVLDVLHTLPVDSEMSPTGNENNENNDTPYDTPAESVAVPDLAPEDTELDQLRQQVMGRRDEEQVHLTMPSFRETPIREFDLSQPVLSWAFPTLYPTGQGEFLMPRLRSVPYQKYAKHLMKYHDGRFARHPRWRYVVFNTLMRKQASERAGYYVRGSERRDVGIEELRDAFEEDTPESRSLLNSVTRFSGSLRGVRPFWKSKRNELLTYAKNLGCPHMFLTLSAADLHWRDLMRHMPRCDEWDRESAENKLRIARANLRENPHIAAYWLYVRFECFKKEVLGRKWNVVDNWSRFEWQGRGSGHTHGLYWISDLPDPEVDKMSAAERQTFAEQWGIQVKAVNPDPSRQRPPLGEAPPLSLAPEYQLNTFGHLSAVVNRVQRHVCGPSYCLRQHRSRGHTYCRFHFPIPLQERPELRKPDGVSYYRLCAVRNDEHLNHYSPLVSLAWLANTDVNPCTGARAMIEYISKYVTKHEEKTATYADVMRKVLQTANPSNALLSAVRKLMNQLIGERDWSAQEICHLLLELPLQQGSRFSLSIDVRPEQQQARAYRFTGTEGEGGPRSAQRGKSPQQKYKERPETLEELTFLDFVRCWDVEKGGRYKERRNARVVSFFPEYDKNTEDFSRVKVMLSHPFRDVDELYVVDGTRFESFRDAYECCKVVHAHGDDYYGKEMPSEPEPSQHIGDEMDTEDNPEPWMDLAGELPEHGATRLEDPDDLGGRDLDRQYDWTRHIGHYGDLTESFWDALKADRPATPTELSRADPRTLEDKQHLFFDMVTKHYEGILNRDGPPQLLINLDGKAGTGKTHVILLLSKVLHDMAGRIGHGCPIIRAAPTGIAAHGIRGRTLHSLFRLPTGPTLHLNDPPTTALQEMQSTFAEVKYLVIDEKSMVQPKQILWIDQRCRAIFAGDREKPFGGLNIILAGDFCQLPPVAGRALYDSRPLNALEEIQGRELYLRFAQTIELDVVRRQEGGNEGADSFKTVLDNLRDDELTQRDWVILASRVQSVVPDEAPMFDESLRLYSTKRRVDDYNHKRMRDLGRPVIKLDAIHEGRDAHKATKDEAGNLESVLHLSIGCRVMLSENIWVERGLVNGAMGALHDIVWHSSTDASDMGPPFALLINFDMYTGPAYATTNEGIPVVPVFMSRREFTVGNSHCIRQHFPISVAYAITVHKAQGMTLDRCVLNITDREFTTGLWYVAISRVKSLDGLLFEQPFDFEQIRSKKKSVIVNMREADMRRRAAQHVPFIAQSTTSIVSPSPRRVQRHNVLSTPASFPDSSLRGSTTPGSSLH